VRLWKKQPPLKTNLKKLERQCQRKRKISLESFDACAKGFDAYANSL
jgi:hypothetical protein